MPNLFVIAGANGAGKSTSAPEILSGPRHVAEFVNADVIAKEQRLSDIAAGRATLERLEALTLARRDLAFETTLASQLLLPRVRAMQAAGYRVHLFFFWLPSADMAVARVAARVASGGHSIPEDVIRRRYERGLHNFFSHYVPMADSWTLFNNTTPPPSRIACRDPKARQEAEQHWTSEDVLQAVNRAVTAALKRHKERGESVVVWRDGKIVWLKPEEIDV